MLPDRPSPAEPVSVPPVRALFVSTSYPRDASDWRGVFMAHISAALSRRDGMALVQWAPAGPTDPRVEIGTAATEAAWLERLMSKGGISHWLRTNPASGLLAAARLLSYVRAACQRHAKVDVYHINWLQTALSLPSDAKPLLITVLGNDMRLLRLPFMRHAVRRVLRGRSAAICPNASWMEAPLRDAFGDLARVVTVPFGVDSRWFAIERRGVHPPRWLVVTRLTANKLGPLFEWSEPLFREGLRELHIYGPMQEELVIPNWVHYHGPATVEQLACECFPNAHGLITLSRHAEGRPQVILEAMASGLPVIASTLPAHKDIVIEGKTGYLCNSKQEYSDALDRLEDWERNREYGNAARSLIAQELGNWDDCASRYVKIYRDLLESSRREIL